MKLQMSSLKFDADQTLLDFVQKKTNKLETYYDHIIDGEVNMHLDKSTTRDNKVVEIKINETINPSKGNVWNPCQVQGVVAATTTIYLGTGANFSPKIMFS